MKRSNDRILTTHTGSLPLPAPVRQALAAKRRGENYDQAVIDATLTTAIGEVVRRQKEVGIDIVNDGELSKTAWNDYVVHRVSGLERKPRSRARSSEPWSVAQGIVRPRNTGLVRSDLEGAPRHYRADIAEFHDLARAQSDGHDNGGMAYVCTGPIGWKDFAAVETDLDSAGLGSQRRPNPMTSSCRPFRPAVSCAFSETNTIPTKKAICRPSPMPCTWSTRPSSMPVSSCNSTVRTWRPAPTRTTPD